MFDLSPLPKMFDIRRLFFLFGLMVCVGWTVSCASSQPKKTSESTPVPGQPDERISLNINEAVYFEFEKSDTVWTGSLTLYTLNENDEKVIKNKYVSANDSTWNDFDAFVDFLDIYEIPPQHQIEGWAPNSGQLPRRVYSFEVFNGDSTRSFSYQDPMQGIRNYWQAQNVLLFSTFVQNDLHWQEVSLN
ncbi:hypothetical protein [Gracilimonas mengyeensis]|uniref:Uncharacterized protein n=1 Tax=Gracilimonas mengyeensis TaxID=1302730 RepID=A0A521CBM9_9BACT|nr:hypothetical protein [Gracilimonas mengyeensis]SMO56804.1 hypothetical protein SAMN06265219_10520 [Gracilimonas mengyeensis]